MREVLSVHEPLLVNTLGHGAGTLIFAIFLALLLRDRAGARLRGSRLTMAAATLALLWCLSSLLVIGLRGTSGIAAEWMVAVSTSALSILPALLLHLSLGDRFRWICRVGYALSVVAVAMHGGEMLLDAPEVHQMALRLTTFGFGALTLLAAAAMLREGGGQRELTSRLVGTMALFLFSISLVHFGVSEPHSWPIELLAHHAAIPLALFVLLQDYRFLLLDAFVRLLANVLLALGFAVTLFFAVDPREVLAWVAGDAFREGMLLVSGCGVLLLFSALRAGLSHALGMLVFRRQPVDALLQELRTLEGDEDGFLRKGGMAIGHFFNASILPVGALPRPDVTVPTPVADLAPEDRDRLEAAGAEVVLPVRHQVLLLGRRSGGRRYLSEDFEALSRIQSEIADQLDRRREAELQRLVSQAELRALQSQIHPHFLFNALNTLYGIIPREAGGARRTVLNLADIFRYFLQSERTFITLEKELEIVKAYLEIEALRLGPKLHTSIEAAPDVLSVQIPILTIEPLVENAIKHGVAQKAAGGSVRVWARREQESLRISVTDTGDGFKDERERRSDTGAGAGVGLENVIRRLQLCYGPEAGLRIDRAGEETTVEFQVPLAQREAALLR
jgi:hypothetical protein